MSETLLNKLNLTPFNPLPLLSSGLGQTIGAYLLPSRQDRTVYRIHLISLDDGDQLSLHVAENTSLKKHIVLMIHGLGGSYQSTYLQRIAPKLCQTGFKVCLLNLRGCGTGAGLAKSIYHSGRSDDVVAVLKWLQKHYPDFKVSIVGFSLGGNVALKLGGENRYPSNLHSLISVSPPLCLHSSVVRITASNRFLHQYYLKNLNQYVQHLHQLHPDLPQPQLEGVKTLMAFDERYTAPRSGFKSALDYYEKSSCFQFIEHIKKPTLILFAQNDPVVCDKHYHRLPKMPHLDLLITASGGHLGWLGKKNLRWMDEVIVRWLGWVL